MRSSARHLSVAKFVLASGLGNAAIRDIGDHLRRHHAAGHWIERYRGKLYIHSSEPRSVALLRTDFTNVLTEVDEQAASEDGDDQ